MSFGLIGKKIGMTQRFQEDGSVVPVTLVQAGPCPVVQVKTRDKDGYEAIQLGYGEPGRRALTKPRKGQFKKNDLEPMQYLREFRVEKSDTYKPGDSLTVEIFSVGEKVDVTGTSKGRGFAGVVKRYHFRGSPRTHGTHRRHRAPGSIGSSAYPSRVYKGKRMAGRMGGDRVTQQNLTVVDVLTDQNLIVIRGALPGPSGEIVTITKGKKFQVKSE